MNGFVIETATTVMESSFGGQSALCDLIKRHHGTLLCLPRLENKSSIRGCMPMVDYRKYQSGKLQDYLQDEPRVLSAVCFAASHTVCVRALLVRQALVARSI